MTELANIITSACKIIEHKRHSSDRSGTLTTQRINRDYMVLVKGQFVTRPLAAVDVISGRIEDPHYIKAHSCIVERPTDQLANRQNC